MKQIFAAFTLIISLAASAQDTKPMTGSPLASSGMTSQDRVVMSLKQCIETGLANNFDVQQRTLQAQSDEVNWKQAKLNLFPDLNGNAGNSFNQGRSIDPFTNAPVTQSFNSSNYGISSSVVLFNGLSLQQTIKQRNFSYKASLADLQQEKDNLTINIILTYLQVLSAADQLVQAKYQLELSSKQVERLDILNREGAIKPASLSDLRGQFASDQLTIIGTQNSLETAKINLARYMNVPYNKNLSLEKIEPESFADRYEQTPAQIYQVAVQQLGVIKAADYRKYSAEKAIAVAKGQLFPTLRFGGNAFTNYSSVAMQGVFVNSTEVASNNYVLVNGSPATVIQKQDNFRYSKINYGDQLNNNLYTSVGFSMTIPLFNSLLQRNRIKQARIEYKNRELSATTTRTQLGQAIDEAYVNMETASDRFKVTSDQVKAFTESFRAAGILFQEGVGNSVDYLVTKNNIDRANINLIIAKYDYVLRSKILDYYQGKPLW